MLEEMSMGREAVGLADSDAGNAALEQQARDCEAGIWRTHDGRTVKIKEMHEGHLRNALAMLRRKGLIGPKTLDFYLRGPRPNGEAAELAYEQELDEIMNAKVNPYIDLLEAEMVRRGLTEDRS